MVVSIAEETRSDKGKGDVLSHAGERQRRLAERRSVSQPVGMRFPSLFRLTCLVVWGLIVGQAHASDAPRIEDFGWVLPQGLQRDFTEPRPGEHPFLETLPQVVARDGRGAVLTLSYLGRVGLTDGRTAFDYFRRGRSAYLSDYLETVPALLGELTPDALGLERGPGWTAARFSVFSEGEQIHYYRVMLEPHVLEISYRSSPADAVLGDLRLSNLLDALQAP